MFPKINNRPLVAREKLLISSIERNVRMSIHSRVNVIQSLEQIWDILSTLGQAEQLTWAS